MSGVINTAASCPISTINTVVADPYKAWFASADAVLLVRQISGSDVPPQETGGSGSSSGKGNSSGSGGGSDDGGGGLSTKAKIAIGVAVPIGVLLLIGGVVAFILMARRRRKNRAGAPQQQQQQHQEAPYGGQMNEADGTSRAAAAPARQELADDKPEPHMLDSTPGKAGATELAGVRDTSNEPASCKT